jgi:septal ring factor EnvC (AmiA/AmiB activator)
VAQPKTFHDLRSGRRLPPSIGLRSEQTRESQLQVLAGDRRRLDRELALTAQRLRALEANLRELETQIEALEHRPVSAAALGGIEAPLRADAPASLLTVEY